MKKNYYWIVGLILTTIAIISNLVNTDNNSSKIFSYVLLASAIIIIALGLKNRSKQRHSNE
ncbi:hypothetical protein EV198_1733 [Roseivirga ehrenbergii]|uniref:Uncharacterized protein n=1 Tax=Roseivirga ehrenbergii (strain DSM 102268 / JCM 13514 / KCTC 12282 / NCIMB 14502 / KMM 6017) TaxID=279360 RepID=A0A150XS12_ROSEK|nr:hypothetical protein [Roseivirga ehrenbergii]KYG81539.1 hypothetical protein MB14_13210 [Roseivirga ehrenbergii]TCL10701.1 hypothetical protein EV198_1733 [Roseivirga ehrenbergii]